MNKNIKGELALMDSLGIKPNYAALGRKYGMDWRTVKKYHNGYEGRPTTRNKGSKLDEYKSEITDKLAIRRITVQGVYQFMIKKYGIERIGSYSNFNRYVITNKLKPKAKTEGHPRFEKYPGEQAQVDWKEDICIHNKFGESFTINILHIVLKFSRFSHLEMTVLKRFDDVSRGLINSFIKFGGVPKELLFDNMSTVANTAIKPKRPTEAIRKMSKDFGFKIKFCKARKPQTKGTVEARNKIVDWIRAYDGEFETIEELETYVENINKDMNITINQETNMSPTALFYKEKEHLHPLPNKDIVDTYLKPNKYKVSSEALIRYGNSKYSVDPKLINEEVTVDLLDNKLYIYYNGKLVTFHALNEKPINYKKEHYKNLMKGKVKDDDMSSIVTENLEMMDKLLLNRKVNVSEKAAIKSEEALIAYINQSEYGKWVINNYAHLSGADRLIFIKGINEVLPYVADREKFISFIKFSMKSNLCKNIALDCWLEDLMHGEYSSYILTEKGFSYFKEKYKKEIDIMLKDISNQAKQEDIESQKRIDKYLSKNKERSCITLKDVDELPFK